MWFQSNPEVSNLQSRKLTDVFFLFLFFLSLSLFLSNHNAISRLRPRQKMQRHREGLLCEWRRLLLHTWYKSALLQVSYLRRFFGFASKMKLFTVNLLCPNSFHDVFFFVVFFTLVIFHNSRFLILLFISLIALDFRSSSAAAAAETHHRENAASLLNYPPVVYFSTNNGVRRRCAHPFKSCLVYRRAAH